MITINHKRLIVAVCTTLTSSFALLSTSTAHADPRRGDPLTVVCDELGTLVTVVFGNALWPPAHVVGTTQVLVPFEARFEITFTPAGGGEPQTFVEERSKPGPRNGRIDHCTFHEQGGDESGTFELDGAVTVSYGPQG